MAVRPRAARRDHPLIPLLPWTGEGYVGLLPVLATAGLVAAPLLVWSFAGAMIGMFLFLPSALQLLLATGADPRRRPTAAGATAGAGLALSAVVLAHFWSE
ncbi:hypothetical protein [Streptomyces sp. cmx-4-7]|uniref:hypothetical protein n=1 Tax=unclassified Streptomyces TaxID=2593676 RepID=UPI0039813635